MVAALMTQWIRGLRLPTAPVRIVRLNLTELLEDEKFFTPRGRSLRRAGRTWALVGAVLLCLGALALTL